MPIESKWIVWEGVHATHRGAAMVQEARRLWHASPKSHGKPHPRIVQGGKSFSSKSGNTHALEAFDFDTSYLDNMENRFWEWCLRVVGFKAWWRPKISGQWNEHNHAIPEGGFLSDAAKVQVRAFHAGRSGLRSNLPDPTIGNLSHRTWEQYLAIRNRPAPPAAARVKISGKYYPDVPYVSLDRLRRAWVTGKRSVDVFHVQRWLARLGYYKAPRDGIRGPVTWKAWTAFLAANKVRDPGSPNLTALKLLAKKAKTVKPVRR